MSEGAKDRESERKGREGEKEKKVVTDEWTEERHKNQTVQTLTWKLT